MKLSYSQEPYCDITPLLATLTCSPHNPAGATRLEKHGTIPDSPRSCEPSVLLQFTATAKPIIIPRRHSPLHQELSAPCPLFPPAKILGHSDGLSHTAPTANPANLDEDMLHAHLRTSNHDWSWDGMVPRSGAYHGNSIQSKVAKPSQKGPAKKIIFMLAPLLLQDSLAAEREATSAERQATGAERKADWGEEAYGSFTDFLRGEE